jgi:hypothetical protein
VEGGELKARQPSPESDAATLTLYFQRCGDDWLAQSGTETFRWWAGFATVRPLVAGEGVVTADLTDPRWSSVMGETKANRRAEFQAALANTCRVGFTLGGGYNFGHGIYSTGPARFTILDFKVEGRRRR